MLEFLTKKLRESDGFVLDIFMSDGSQLLRSSLWKHDATGIVVEDDGGEMRLLPWTSIQAIIFEEV